jgi:hypothetical protein
MERELHFDAILQTHHAAEHDMKIYLLIVLMSSLWTAIYFTSTPKQGSKRLPQ